MVPFAPCGATPQAARVGPAHGAARCQGSLRSGGHALQSLGAGACEGLGWRGVAFASGLACQGRPQRRRHATAVARAAKAKRGVGTKQQKVEAELRRLSWQWMGTLWTGSRP
mmetsp:Transcript_120744/g.336932  ORF Transcript_120744/g.336932 Transcript_120744/m.336932 type:complete len:112 (+) Transcript_120744:46-381(+)